MEAAAARCMLVGVGYQVKAIISLTWQLSAGLETPWDSPGGAGNCGKLSNFYSQQFKELDMYSDFFCILCERKLMMFILLLSIQSLTRGETNSQGFLMENVGCEGSLFQEHKAITLKALSLPATVALCAEKQSAGARHSSLWLLIYCKSIQIANVVVAAMLFIKI